MQSRFVYGTRSHVADYMVRGGATYRLVSDDKGSVRLVVDVATGVVAQAIEYDAWGVVVADTSPGFQPFGYAGGLYDADTGLVRFGERDYDPVAGRWTSKDPIGFGGGDPNLYAYVGGDPVNAIDPEGLIFESVSATCSRAPLLCSQLGLAMGAAAAQVHRARPVSGFLSRGVQQACGQARRIGSAVERHHAWPKYLGGPKKQVLVPLRTALHRLFHRGLDKAAPRWKGKAYYDAMSPQARLRMLQDLASFVRHFDAANGTDLMTALKAAGFPL